MRVHVMRSRQRGQSIPLIALMIVVLVGFVGLSVDVGNTYAQQRNTVRGTNAAAVAGMNVLIQGASDQSVGQVIQQSLKSNDIKGTYLSGSFSESDMVSTPDSRLIEAYYLDSKGNYLATCNVGSCGSVPSGVTYIQVRVRGTVSTYFARVLNRPTFPVNAQAYAGRCTPVQGVYPIGVQSSSLDAKGFKAPQDPADVAYYKTYKDTNYPGGLTQRRIYLKDDANSPGNFGYLRWQSAGNATATLAMLAGPGNLENGFDEGIVDNKGVTQWPDPKTTPPMVNGKVVYPIKPHELNSGDWIMANTGVSMSSGITGAMQAHITNKDVLILPIVGPAVGTGNNGAFQLASLGAFYVVGMGTNGANGYYDLVFIGTANSVACLSTPAVVSNTLGINGQVFVKPRWGVPQNSEPIAYEIIMDVSGSMTWNFKGQGTDNATVKKEANSVGGTTVQCETTDTATANAVCTGGTNDPWKTVSERRIYVLKHALTDPGGFIQSMRAIDTMRIVTFTTGGDNKASINTGPGWSNDKTALTTAVMNAGMYNNDRYLTAGGTPGADGINKAAALLKSSPPPANAAGPYKHAVIYMTDGVANVFLGGTLNIAADLCPGMGQKAYSTPQCQYDPPPNYTPAAAGMRPITAMIDQANKMKNSITNMQLFVIALANVSPLGLDQVATNPKMLYLAKDSSLVPSVLDQIQAKAAGPCIEAGGANWIDNIDAAHTASFPSGPTPPLGVYGYVQLYKDDGTPVAVPWTGPGADPRGAQTNLIPITQDGVGDNLTYSVPTTNGLAPGVYRQTAYIYYKAAAPDGDGVSRQYDVIMNGLTSVQYATFTVTPSDVLGSSMVIAPLRLDLKSTVNLCN